MQTRRLGRTELDLTTVGLGTWAIGGAGWQFAWGPQDDGDFREYFGVFHCKFCHRNGCQKLTINRRAEPGWQPSDREISERMLEMVKRNHDCLVPPLGLGDIGRA